MTGTVHMRCGGVKPGVPAAETVQIPGGSPGTLSSREMRHSDGVAQRQVLSTIANGKLYANFDQIYRRLRVPGCRYFGHGSL
jgi:hypothetical protein